MPCRCRSYEGLCTQAPQDSPMGGGGMPPAAKNIGSASVLYPTRAGIG